MVTNKECMVDATLKDLINGAVDILIEDIDFDSADKRERVEKAFVVIKDEIRKATAAMSSVPKPLKFMKGRFKEIEESYNKIRDATDPETKKVRVLLADLLSVVSYTLPSPPLTLSDFEIIPEILQKNQEAIDARAKLSEKERETEPKPDSESLLQKFEQLTTKRATDLYNEGLSQNRKGILYRLEGSRGEDLFGYGKEYIRSLTVDLLGEFNMRHALKVLEVEVPGHGDLKTNDDVLDCLQSIGQEIIKDLFTCNTFVDAVDVGAELQYIDKLAGIIRDAVKEESIRLRIADYLLNLGKYDSEIADQLLQTAIDIVREIDRPSEGLRYAVTAYSRWAIKPEVLTAYVLDLFQHTYSMADKLKGRAQRLQMLFMIGDCDITALFDINKSFIDNIPEDAEVPKEEQQLWVSVFNKDKMRIYYKHLIEELDLIEPKHPNDVYKTYLSTGASQSMDSTSKNKASTYVNGLVNAGFGNDSLLHEDGTASWIYKNHLSAMAAASASEGALHLWNVEEGYQAMDTYLWAEETYIKAGSYIGFGIVSSGTRGEFNSALDIIGDSLNASGKLLELKCGLIGLSLAYNNMHNDEVTERVTPFAFDGGAPDNESASLAALTLAMNKLGSKDDNIAESLIQLMMTLSMDSTSNLDTEYHYKFVALALGLLYMGSGEDEAAGVIEVISNMGPTPFRKGTQILLEALSCVGSGNIDMQARMFRIITDGADVDRDEDSDDANKDDKEQRYTHDLDRKMAVLGAALIGMGDEIGTAMILKAAESWLHFGDIVVVRTVPLALAILFASNPQNTVLDLLSKLSYDSDPETALTSILSLAIVAAGTNNAKVAKLLRQMASYYQKSSMALLCVRWAQGLVHLGKGLLSLSPVCYRGDVIKRTHLAHLMVVVISCLNMQRHLMEEHNHLLLWHLVCAASPKMLMIVDHETLEAKAISMRVGKSVNTVGVPGNPRSVTSFQTHTSPIVIGYGDQAEVDLSAEGTLNDPSQKLSDANQEIRVELFSSMLEGVVLVSKTVTTITT